MNIIDYTKLITIEPSKRSGQPCIRGLRMTVRDVLEYLAALRLFRHNYNFDGTELLSTLSGK